MLDELRTSASGEMVNILLIEDDAIAAEAVTRAIRAARIGNPIHWVIDGREAIDTLKGLEGKERLRRPYIILLDLNLPRIDGFKFLEILRDDPELDDSIVFVLTTSQSDRDRAAAYKKHVAGYIVKSSAGTDFLELIKLLKQYWSVVQLPKEGDATWRTD